MICTIQYLSCKVHENNFLEAVVAGMNGLPQGDGETIPPLRPPPSSLPRHSLEPGEAGPSPARTRSPAASPVRKRYISKTVDLKVYI